MPEGSAPDRPAHRRPAPVQAPVPAAPPSPDTLFLSPRVLDRAAFETYSARLRELAESLNSEATSAREAVALAQQAGGTAREIASKQKEQLDAASKVLAGLEARTADLSAMLEKAGDLATAGAKFEREADRIIALRFSTLEKRLTETMDGFVKQVQTRMDAKSRQMAGVLDEMKAAQEAIRRQVETDVAATLESLRSECARAEALTGLGATTTGAPPPGSLAALVERAAEAQDRASIAAEQLGVIEQRADLSARRLGESLAANIRDGEAVIAERRTALASLENAVRTAQEAERLLSDRAGDAARVLGPFTDLHKASEESAARLRAMINESETSRTGMADAAETARATAQRLAAILDELRPWKSVLLEGSKTESLPEPIARTIDAIRAEMAHDLSRMASAMTLIAGRAHATPRTEREAPEIVVRSVETAPAPTPAAKRDH